MGGYPVEDRADRLLGVRPGRILRSEVRGHRVGPFTVVHDPVIALEVQAGDVVVGRRQVQVDRTLGPGDEACDRVQDDLVGVLPHEQHRHPVHPAPTFVNRLRDPPGPPAGRPGPALDLTDEGVQAIQP